MVSVLLCWGGDYQQLTAFGEADLPERRVFLFDLFLEAERLIVPQVSAPFRVVCAPLSRFELGVQLDDMIAQQL
jgi:hypothetical protein